MKSPLFHLIVYCPEGAAEAVRKALASAGAGKIGNYDGCSFSTKGTGRFRPNEQANPAIGSAGEMESVAEEKIEVQVEESLLPAVIRAVKAVHPYEEPAMHILPMRDYHDFL